jgi:hypothetical protein
MRTAIGLLGCLALAALAHAFAPAGEDAAMEREAAAFLASLPPELSARATIPFADAERENWDFFPRERRGVPIGALSSEARARLDALLAAALSSDGCAKVAGVLGLERAIGRDPGAYYASVFGEPGEARPWGWRLEGHHLSLNFTCDGERTLSVTPHFFGASPLELAGERGTAPFRVLGSEEARARELVAGLSPELLARAVRPGAPPGEIVLLPGVRVDSLAREGLSAADLDAAGRALFFALVAEFAYHLKPDLAEPELERVRAADPDELSFLWAGSTEPGEPFYFRAHGPTFVIEYENGRSGADHVHSVWRDPANDFGADALRRHLERDHGH